jgi:hypothetical protein
MLKNGRIYPNTQLRITMTFRDDAGTLTDPTTVTVKTYDPCGGEETYVYLTDAEIQKSSIGIYYADITPDSAGRWHYRWETTGPVFATEDSFSVLTSPFVDSCARDYV